MQAKITCYGGAGSPTGANFCIEIENESLDTTERILVDCGMMQGGEEAFERNNKKFSYDASKINKLFVTHAHIDHIGLIPKLYKEGFRGEIYSTPETKSISELLLKDAVKIGLEDEKSLYSIHDIENSLLLWDTFKYHEKRDFGNFSVEFYDAGHILGSTMIRFFFLSGKNMLFTGDIGNSPSPLLPNHEKVTDLDYLLMESVYGNRNHEDRELRDKKFKKVVEESIAKGGTLLIPAFSLERTQEILSMLDNLFESNTIPSVPVFLDSPLAIKITDIYEKARGLYKKEVEEEINRGDEIFRFPRLKETARAQDSQTIRKVTGAKIIIAGSGMSTAGRILFHEAEYLPDPNSTILFMGYQAAGTLGRQIEEGVKKINIGEKEIKVLAKIVKIDGYSGHADSDALVEFVESSEKTLKKVFIAMGEPISQIFLAQRIMDEFSIKAIATEEGKSYIIEI